MIAASDYIKTYADQIRPFIKDSYTTLGTDGFGRSDSRKKLRHFFEVDSNFIVLASLTALYQQGEIEKTVLAEAIKQLDIHADKANPART